MPSQTHTWCLLQRFVSSLWQFQEVSTKSVSFWTAKCTSQAGWWNWCWWLMPEDVLRSHLGYPKDSAEKGCPELSCSSDSFPGRRLGQEPWSWHFLPKSNRFRMGSLPLAKNGTQLGTKSTWKKTCEKGKVKLHVTVQVFILIKVMWCKTIF